MQYLPLFLLMMAVLIAAYFYLQRAKARDAGTTVERTEAPSEPAASAPAAPSEPAAPTQPAPPAQPSPPPGQSATGTAETDDRPQ